MEKTLQNVSDLLGTKIARFWYNRFKRVRQMQGASRKFRCIADTRNREQLYDYLAEILYALAFAGLEFQVEMEPFGKKGTDLRISRDGYSATVEIMRFRRIYAGPSEFSLSDEAPILETYGNPPRDTKKAFEKILTKFSQVKVSNDGSFIAIWNDDEDLEEKEVKQAVRDLCNVETRQILSLPRNLLFILYGSKWISLDNQQQIYCFPLQVLGEPQVTWVRELERSYVDELIQRALNQQTKGGG